MNEAFTAFLASYLREANNPEQLRALYRQLGEELGIEPQSGGITAEELATLREAREILARL